jgi:hypothetical protein
MSEESLTSLISNWVSTDNEIRELNSKLRELRETRSKQTSLVHTYMENSNILNNKIEIRDSELKMRNVTTYSGITFKSVEKSLIKFIDDEELIKTIMKDIKDSRIPKTSVEFKRTFKNI